MNFDKQQAALVALCGSIANTFVAFGVVNATLAGALNSLGMGVVSVVLYYLHRRDGAA
jgi:hypothetical protein